MPRAATIDSIISFSKPNKGDVVAISLLLFPFIALLTPLVQVTTDYQSPLYQVLFYCKMVSLAVVVFLYMKNFKISDFDKSVLIFVVLWTVSVLLNSNDFNTIINEVGAIVFYCCLFGYYCRKSPVSFILVYFVGLGFMLFLNLAFLVIHPDGLKQTDSIWNSSRINFLGLDNQISPLLFIWFILLYVCRRLGYYKRAITMIGAVVIAGNVILLNVGTLYTAALLFILCQFAYRRMPRLFHINAALILIFTLFVSIVLLRLQYLFEFFIVDVLDKDITLTGRLVIWDEAIMLILNQPFFGYGLSSIGWLVQGNRHAHNTILQIVLQCGLLGFAAFFVVILKAARSFLLKRYRLPPFYVFFTIVFLAYNVACLTEVYAITYYFIILLLLHYSRYYQLVFRIRKKIALKSWRINVL